MFHGVICKYFGGGLSVYILESNIKLVSIYMHKSNFQKSCGGHCPPMPKHSSIPSCAHFIILILAFSICILSFISLFFLLILFVSTKKIVIFYVFAFFFFWMMLIYSNCFFIKFCIIKVC